MSDSETPIVPATTVLLVRDIADDFEVFMVARHPKSNFAAGALVFPGGKLDPQDSDEALLATCRSQQGPDGAFTDEELAFRICGIRETFEEASVMLARDTASGEDLSDERNNTIVQTYREALHKGDIGLLEIVQKESLTLACDKMTLFAHWITPTFFPRRFDTYFFLAGVSADQAALHDGIESTESLWTTPSDALDDGDAGRKIVVFATRANLRKLALHSTVKALAENTLANEVITIEPNITDNDGDVTFRIPTNAGYPLTEHTEYGGSLLKVKDKKY